MGELIVPGTLGVVTDVAGLLVVLMTTIPLMQNLGIVGAFWVASIIATVEILHPVMICYLPPPTRHQHFVPRFMVRFTERRRQRGHPPTLEVRNRVCDRRALRRVGPCRVQSREDR